MQKHAPAAHSTGRGVVAKVPQDAASKILLPLQQDLGGSSLEGIDTALNMCTLEEVFIDLAEKAQDPEWLLKYGQEPEKLKWYEKCDPRKRGSTPRPSLTTRPRRRRAPRATSLRHASRPHKRPTARAMGHRPTQRRRRCSATRSPFGRQASRPSTRRSRRRTSVPSEAEGEGPDSCVHHVPARPPLRCRGHRVTDCGLPRSTVTSRRPTRRPFPPSSSPASRASTCPSPTPTGVDQPHHLRAPIHQQRQGLQGAVPRQGAQGTPKDLPRVLYPPHPAGPLRVSAAGRAA